MAEPFGVSADGCAYVPISVAPVPLLSVALWKRFVKPAPVVALPTFEIVEERATAVPAVAEVGETAPAVRSGEVGAAITTDAEHWPPFPLLS